MQRVFVGLLVGAVQPAVLRTARAAIDFIYYSQLHVHTSTTLDALQDALKIFHENKDIFIREGVREHFNIPKLHQMLHYCEAIKSRGAADGYNTESPERLHIDFAKEAYRASNGRDYEEQMVKWLGRQEAVARFRAYLDWSLWQPPPQPLPQLVCPSLITYPFNPGFLSQTLIHSPLASSPSTSFLHSQRSSVVPTPHLPSRYFQTLPTNLTYISAYPFTCPISRLLDASRQLSVPVQHR